MEEDVALLLIRFQDALGGQYGKLSRPKLRLMVKLTDGPVSVSNLAERLHISSPAVSQMIDKLVGDGLVVRLSSERDQRLVSVMMTALGNEVLAEALAAFRSRVGSLMSQLTTEEQIVFTRLLQNLGQVM
jgi:DNA-binding MarR family transcriptional regulator